MHPLVWTVITDANIVLTAANFLFLLWISQSWFSLLLIYWSWRMWNIEFCCCWLFTSIMRMNHFMICWFFNLNVFQCFLICAQCETSQSNLLAVRRKYSFFWRILTNSTSWLQESVKWLLWFDPVQGVVYQHSCSKMFHTGPLIPMLCRLSIREEGSSSPKSFLPYGSNCVMFSLFFFFFKKKRKPKMKWSQSWL